MNIEPPIAFLNLIIECCRPNENAYFIEHIERDIRHIKFLAENDSDRLAEFNSYTIFSDFLNGKVDFQGAIVSLCLSY